MASMVKASVVAIIGAASLADAFAPAALPLRPTRAAAVSRISPNMAQVGVTVQEAGGDKNFKCEK